MAKTAFKSVDEYIASYPPAVQRVLKRLRSTILKAVPGAQEVISYQIPTYKLHGRSVLYFAGWSQHYSLYRGVPKPRTRLASQSSTVVK
jgi:uncharacterized protein YdhG (YjbR/CyaY superfamily)